ncbi:MAG: serine hydrolase domain-containing protein [Gemmatimonadota bacterium]
MPTFIRSLALAALAAAAPSIMPAQGVPPSPISQADLIGRLNHNVDSLAALDQFSGVVLLALDGKPVLQRAVGMADREAKRPNTLETAFNIGSINKVFTATAIRQLAAAGKLDPDSTLATYWPDYPNADVARRITIRQLLRHTSGIGGNIFAAPAGGQRHDIRRLQDYLPLFVSEPLQFEPGSKDAYSNAGFVVLGLLIERLSGESYYDYVAHHILQPAGMTRTGSYAVDSLPPTTAVGYTTGDRDAAPGAPRHSNREDLPGRGSSAGGGYSTAGDLLKFMVAVQAGTIPGTPKGGLGIAGGSGGLNASLEGPLPGGYVLIVLANLDPPAAERVSEMVRHWLGFKMDQ